MDINPPEEEILINDHQSTEEVLEVENASEKTEVKDDLTKYSAGFRDCNIGGSSIW